MLSRKRRKCAIFLFAGVYAVELRLCALQGAAMLVRSLLMKSRKRLVHDVMSATHPCCVHDVTDTDYQTQNGGSYGRVFATFKR